MNVKVTWIARLATAAVALAAFSAHAQTDNHDFELERLQFNSSGSGALTVWDGTLMVPGSVRAGLGGQYEYAPLVLHREDGFPFGILVKERATIHALLAFTVTPWVEVDAQVPAIFFQNGSTTAGLTTPRGKEVGTPWVAVRFPLLREGMLGMALPLHVGGELALGIPAGPKDQYANPHGAELAPRINAGFSFGAIQGAVELNALLRPDSSLESFSGSIYDRALSTWGAAVMLSTGGTGARVEVTGRVARNFFAPGWGAELEAGLRLPFSPRGPELFVEAGPGAGNLIGQPTFRVFAGLAFGGSSKPLGGPASVESPTLPLPPPKVAPAAPAPAVQPAPPAATPPALAPAPTPAPAAEPTPAPAPKP